MTITVYYHVTTYYVLEKKISRLYILSPTIVNVIIYYQLQCVLSTVYNVVLPQTLKSLM